MQKFTVTLIEIQFLNEHQVIQRWLHAAHMAGARVCAADSWFMLCHVREQDPDPIIGTASRAPHHNATEPRGTDPNRANGSRSWAPYRPSISLSAPVSSSDPNTNWHLINILSEGFISLTFTSRCLSSFALLKTMDALITQNSICVRERFATRVLSLKWAAQNGWMHISFNLEKRFFILQTFLSLRI